MRRIVGLASIVVTLAQALVTSATARVSLAFRLDDQFTRPHDARAFGEDHGARQGLGDLPFCVIARAVAKFVFGY